ncbi:hypothetical protein [Actinophytocola sp.]|uniref:hypothetical protein n=1 Tax=Actinophytocola sp. TaxID=1872138 RepID=UPI003D6B6754
MTVEEKSLQRSTEVDAPLEQQVRAVRAVASAAKDVNDCRRLLDMLGLNPRPHVPTAPEPRAER